MVLIVKLRVVRQIQKESLKQNAQFHSHKIKMLDQMNAALNSSELVMN
jgi:hypothetical protein